MAAGSDELMPPDPEELLILAEDMYFGSATSALAMMLPVFLFLLGPGVISISDFLENTAEQLKQNRTDQQP